MGAIPIDQSIEYENGKFSCAFTVTEQAVKDLNDKVDFRMNDFIHALVTVWAIVSAFLLFAFVVQLLGMLVDWLVC